MLADTKTADGGTLEAEMVFAAGAAMMTVLANASPATLRNTSDVARKYGREVVFDTILDEEVDVDAFADDQRHGDVWLALHAPSDMRRAGAENDDHITRVADRHARGFLVCLAGGIRRSNLARVLDVSPEIVVVGAGVTEARDPAGEAAWIRDQVDVTNRGS